MLRTFSTIKNRDYVIRLFEKQAYTKDGEQRVLACKDEETGKSIPGSSKGEEANFTLRFRETPEGQSIDNIASENRGSHCGPRAE